MDSVAGTVETVLVRRCIQCHRPRSVVRRLECRPFYKVKCRVKEAASAADTLLHMRNETNFFF